MTLKCPLSPCTTGMVQWVVAGRRNKDKKKRAPDATGARCGAEAVDYYFSLSQPQLRAAVLNRLTSLVIFFLRTTPAA